MSRAALGSAWRVHLPTADETCIRVRCAGDGSGPWPVSRALVELRRLGVRPAERFRSLGAGRGRPLLHSQEADWCDLALHLESFAGRDGAIEAALSLPSMAEIDAAGVDEEGWWGLVDAFSTAVDAVHGAIVDGEPIALEAPADAAGWHRRLGDHIGLLAPAHLAIDWRPLGAAYTTLPLSQLVVVLR